MRLTTRCLRGWVQSMWSPLHGVAPSVATECKLVAVCGQAAIGKRVYVQVTPEGPVWAHYNSSTLYLRATQKHPSPPAFCPLLSAGEGAVAPGLMTS